MEVFFSNLSSAHTFKVGSLGRSSAIVTSNEVPWTCLMCVMAPVSWAWNERTTLKALDTMRMIPSALPRKRFSDPEATAVMFPLYGMSGSIRTNRRGSDTSKSDELSSSGS